MTHFDTDADMSSSDRQKIIDRMTRYVDSMSDADIRSVARSEQSLRDFAVDLFIRFAKELFGYVVRRVASALVDILFQ